MRRGPCFLGAACLVVAVPNGAPASSGWHEVTPAGPRSAALMRTAETERSDLGFAGMMVRCIDHRLEPVIVVVEPLPPNTAVAVNLDAGGDQIDLAGTLLPTGAGVILPLDLESRLAAAWRDEPDLSVTLRLPQARVRGVLSLQGLTMALPAFAARCRADAPAP